MRLSTDGDNSLVKLLSLRPYGRFGSLAGDPRTERRRAVAVAVVRLDAVDENFERRRYALGQHGVVRVKVDAWTRSTISLA